MPIYHTSRFFLQNKLKKNTVDIALTVFSNVKSWCHYIYVFQGLTQRHYQWQVWRSIGHINSKLPLLLWKEITHQTFQVFSEQNKQVIHFIAMFLVCLDDVKRSFAILWVYVSSPCESFLKQVLYLNYYWIVLFSPFWAIT